VRGGESKTKDVRNVPIEPALLPLLEKMHDEAAGEGRVIGATPPRAARATHLVEYAPPGNHADDNVVALDPSRRAGR
jgi:hypothetical protein